MGKYEKVARTADLEPGSGTAVEAGGYSLALFNVDGKFYALDNVCPHQGGPLSEGMLEGDVVACPWHGWTFNVKDGSCTLNPGASVRTLNVKVDGGDVWVEKP